MQIKQSICIGLELPWNIASDNDKDFELWKTTDYASHSPWCKLDTLALSLVRKILIPTPSKRYNLLQIKSHHWLMNSNATSMFLFNLTNHL